MNIFPYETLDFTKKIVLNKSIPSEKSFMSNNEESDLSLAESERDISVL